MAASKSCCRPEGEAPQRRHSRGRNRGTDRRKTHEIGGPGLSGELLALEHEKGRLSTAGHTDLAEQVRHVAVEEGDGAVYDTRSYSTDGSELYIEVKTTRGTAETQFFLTANELAFSHAHAHRYELWHLYEYRDPPVASFDRISGDLSQQLALTPTNYRAALEATCGPRHELLTRQ